jgi:predicted TIM-barrel fold metal-dependent hydrolase
MIDIHVHFFPPSVFRAIWDYFEAQSHGLWTIRYRLHGREHVAELTAQGVERFTSLVYAHKAGLAPYLNDYVLESAAEFPEIIPFGTVFAGDGDVEATARRIFEEYGFYGIKLHPFVSGEELDDPRLFPVYEAMEAGGKVLVCHPGSGPVYPKTDGAGRLLAVLSRFPALKVVVAHCGAFEYGDFAALADEFESVYFDTAMNCVDSHVFEDSCPGREFFAKFQDRVLYGSDFPNIPYEYSAQPQSLRRLALGPEVEAKIFHDNAVRLLGL